MTDLREERTNNLSALSEKLSFDHPAFAEAAQKATADNPWFTQNDIQLAVTGIKEHFLNADLIRPWIDQYEPATNPRKVGIIMAGNIPLVGFHDLLCTYLSGHIGLVKTSDKDDALMRFAIDTLNGMHQNNPPFELVNTLKGQEAVIATGSNQSRTYFETYFGKYPNILRGHRSAVAVLHGDEGEEEIYELGKDVFTYYGLGCRNVSKLYIPRGFDTQKIMEVFERYRYVVDHHKYKNNLDYNVALFLLSKFQYLNNGVILLLENEAISSRIAALHYSYYDNIDEVKQELTAKEKEIQCVVGRHPLLSPSIPFGEAQSPSLADYADHIDTMQFLSQLK